MNESAVGPVGVDGAIDRIGGRGLCARFHDRERAKRPAAGTAQLAQDRAQPDMRPVPIDQRSKFKPPGMITAMVGAMDPAMIIHPRGFKDADIAIPIMTHIFFT